LNKIFLYIFKHHEMTIFEKRAINKINTRGARNFNLAEIIPFEPESLILIQGSEDLINFSNNTLKNL